jgi:predicted nucleic acid-binding protein
VNAYPDTSFLFGLYVSQANSKEANAHAATMKEPIHVGSLLRFEFANAVRCAAQRGAIQPQNATAALAAFDADIDAGVVVIPPVSWELVHAEAERLSNAQSWRTGHSSFDILHVATAVTLEAREFLTFDAKQAALAKVAGLKVKLTSV